MKLSEFRSFKKQVVQEEVENGDKQFGMNLKSKTVQDLQDQQQVNAMKGQYSGKDSVLEELHQKANSVFLPPEEASNREIAHALSEWMVKHADYRAFLSVEIEIMKYDPETGTWNENAEVKAKQDIREAVGNLYSQYLKRETLDQIEAIDPVPRDRIGPGQNQVPVKNGILHL